MHADEATSPGDSHPTNTPIYDAMVRALATVESTSGGDSPGREPAGCDTDTPQAGAREEPSQDPANSGHNHPTTPTYVIDPDTPEGAAIFQLFRRLHDIAQGDVAWPGADIVNELSIWFAEDLGIDPHEPPIEAEHRLRMAQCHRAGGRPSAAVQGLRIGTDHPAPEPIIRAALRALANPLDPGTGIGLVTDDRNVLARIEQHPFPATSR